MKDGAIDHRKMKALARALRIPLPYANGIMERLWHAAEKYAPDGAIGRSSNADIADYCGMPVEVDPDVLVNALIEVRFLDRLPEPTRLYVHDWHEHCTHYTHRKLVRRGAYFANGDAPAQTRLDRKERAEYSQTYGSESGNHPMPDARRTPAGRPPDAESGVSGAELPNLDAQRSRTRPTPTPPPTPPPPPPPPPTPLPTHTQGAACASDFDGTESRRWDEFWRAYPRKQRKDFACQQFLSVVTAANEDQVFRCLDRYLGSDEVVRGVVANPDKWLYEQYRNDWEGDWPKRSDNPGVVSPKKQVAIDESRIVQYNPFGPGKKATA